MKSRMHLEWIVLGAVLCLLAHIGQAAGVLAACGPFLLAAPGLVWLLLPAREASPGARWLPALWEPAERLCPPAVFCPEDPVSCALAAATVDGSYAALLPNLSG